MRDADKTCQETEDIIVLDADASMRLLISLLFTFFAFGLLIFLSSPNSIVVFLLILYVAFLNLLSAFTKKLIILDKKLQIISVRKYFINFIYSLKEIPSSHVKDIRVIKTHLPATENFDEGESWSTEIVTYSGESISIHCPSGQSDADRIAVKIRNMTNAGISYINS